MVLTYPVESFPNFQLPSPFSKAIVEWREKMREIEDKVHAFSFMIDVSRPVFIFEEKIVFEEKGEDQCDVCEEFGKYFSGATFHVVMPEDYFPIEIIRHAKNHFFHIEIHENGEAHLHQVRGRAGGGFMEGEQMMLLVERVAKVLHVSCIMVEDKSYIRGMDLKVLHALKDGNTWFEKLRYDYHGQGKEKYKKAMDVLRRVNVRDLNLGYGWGHVLEDYHRAKGIDSTFLSSTLQSFSVSSDINHVEALLHGMISEMNMLCDATFLLVSIKGEIEEVELIRILEKNYSKELVAYFVKRLENFVLWTSKIVKIVEEGGKVVYKMGENSTVLGETDYIIQLFENIYMRNKIPPTFEDEVVDSVVVDAIFVADEDSIEHALSVVKDARFFVKSL